MKSKREIKGNVIANKQDQITRIKDGIYKVKSQSFDKY